jgi:hypothetical protein
MLDTKSDVLPDGLVRHFASRYTDEAFADGVFDRLIEPLKIRSMIESHLPDQTEEAHGALLEGGISDLCMAMFNVGNRKSIIPGGYRRRSKQFDFHIDPGFRVGVQHYDDWLGGYCKGFHSEDKRDVDMLAMNEVQERVLYGQANSGRAMATSTNVEFIDYLRATAIDAGRDDIDIESFADGHQWGVEYSFITGETYVTAKNCSLVEAAISAAHHGCRKIAFIGDHDVTYEDEDMEGIFEDLMVCKPTRDRQPPTMCVLQLEFSTPQKLIDVFKLRRTGFRPGS